MLCIITNKRRTLRCINLGVLLLFFLENNDSKIIFNSKYHQKIYYNKCIGKI